MEENTDDVISIKQKIKDSLNNDFYHYLQPKIEKNVKDCNYLYTKVCYLIKLFLLYEFENNINYNSVNYDFNELFIRFCFKLIKKNPLDLSDLLDSEKKDNNKIRLFNFFKDFNKNSENIPFFICSDKLDSISHITNAISRDISTNIKNNIIINFNKYLKEYIKINLKLLFENTNFKISNDIIYSVYDDILHNTLYSNNIFHNWIINNKNLIIPDFNNDIIHIDSIEDGIKKYPIILKKFIIKYIKNDESLIQICFLNNIKNNKIKIIHDKLYEDIVNNTLNSENIFHEWIKYNILFIKNNFNSINYIDIDSKLNSEPFMFIKHMIFMNKNLEINKSKKHYQIIPLRTNMTPKHIPINTHALVDILDSSYLDYNKNDYHNDTSKGIDIWNKFFLFSSDYIEQTIKKGFIFSGLILTNGHEIIFNFYSKKYMDKKNNFHLKGKNEIKHKKEIIKNLLDSEKEAFLEKYDIEKNEIKNNKKIESNEKFKKIKENEKKLEDEKLKNVEEELKILIDKYNNDSENLKNILLNNENTLEYNTEKYKSSIAYLTHCFNRDKDTLINDYKNDIDEQYNKIIIEDDNINLKINELKILLKNKKNNLKKLKHKNKKKSKNIFNENERKKLVRIINKIRIKNNLLNYECNDKNLTLTHIKRIKETLKNLINTNEIIKNNFLLNYKEIDILKTETQEIKIIINEFISVFVEEIIKEKYKKNKIEVINKDIKENCSMYNTILNEIKVISNNLCIEIENKKKNYKKINDMFKNKNNEYMKIDTMSKKYLKILENLNWCVIDPGINSLFNILSKDGEKKYNYSKKFHNNRISFYKINKKIIKIKKEKIINIENELSKEENRVKTSNDYMIFKKYYNKKMSIHKELEILYNDERLNKLKWNLFINQKRAEDMIINDIKNKFGNDVVLILGDWSMNKQVIKGISPTPNKKYTQLLEKNFITLKINEYRTSIINNHLKKKCENYISKYNNKLKKIKSVYNLEKMKNIDNEKYLKKTENKSIHKILVCKANEKLKEYVNRDNNATKNMKDIVFSYIKTNYRPKSFVLGTKICKHSLRVL